MTRDRWLVFAALVALSVGISALMARVWGWL